MEVNGDVVEEETGWVSVRSCIYALAVVMLLNVIDWLSPPFDVTSVGGLSSGRPRSTSCALPQCQPHHQSNAFYLSTLTCHEENSARWDVSREVSLERRNTVTSCRAAEIEFSAPLSARLRLDLVNEMGLQMWLTRVVF